MQSASDAGQHLARSRPYAQRNLLSMYVFDSAQRSGVRHDNMLFFTRGESQRQ